MGFEIEDGVLVKYIHEKGDTEITIPDNITYIKDKALYNCSSLTRINVDNNNNTYCDIDGVVFSKDRKKLILCPDGKSGSYIIPDNVTTITNRAFKWCLRLTDITIPASTVNIENYAFEWCSNLSRINVNDNNMTYCSIDGVLFSKDRKKLILCLRGKSGNYVIPESVTTIGNRAFEWCVRLTDIILPDSITIIDDYAFEYCCNLKNIVIPSNVKSIGKNAFYNCSCLTTVNIPDSVDHIGNNAFLGCRSLVNVSLPHHFKIFPSHTAITYR